MKMSSLPCCYTYILKLEAKEGDNSHKRHNQDTGDKGVTSTAVGCIDANTISNRVNNLPDWAGQASGFVLIIIR